MKHCKILIFSTLLCLIALYYPTSSYSQNNSDSLNQYSDFPELITKNKGQENKASTKIKSKNNKNDNEISIIENHYKDKTAQELKQFGYNIFEDIDNKDKYIPSGSVQDDFIINIGDELEIITRGQKNSRKIITVDLKGRIIIDDIPPIIAAGLSFKQLKEKLDIETSQLPNTKIYLSIHKIKDIGVLIAGNVKYPGKKTLPKFSTITDALIQAGGITKNGSLRKIRLIRNGITTNIDMYKLLIWGNAKDDYTLMNGDRIIIPPIGATIAITGEVKNPAIYEIDIKSPVKIDSILNLAGGTINNSSYRIIHSLPSKDGNNHIDEVKRNNLEQLKDGSIIIVNKIIPKKNNSIEITGHTSRPGLYDLTKTSTLSSLFVKNDILGNNIYPLIAIIERTNKNSLTKEYIVFSPSLVISNEFDKKLKNRDKLYLFSNDDIKNIINSNKDNESEEITDFVENIKNIIIEHTVPVKGAIRNEGLYPIAKNTKITSLIKSAGDFSINADKSSIEITRSNNQRNIINILENDEIRINPGDSLRVNPKENKYIKNEVLLIGEVKRPGKYNLIEGDTLLKLIERAGGLTENAYTEGTIFSRLSERKREEKRFKTKAQELEIKLASMLSDEKNKPNPEQVKITKDLIKQLNSSKAIGRITVESNPEILKTYPEQDILLEAEDKIYIPKRPLTVRVAGEVLSPANLQFTKDKNFNDYIKEAGGYSYYADKKRAFVIFPNGSAQPAGNSYWEHTNLKIPPGSTIIVPQNPEPFDFIESAKNITQILTNIAITGIFLDDIRNN